MNLPFDLPLMGCKIFNPLKIKYSCCVQPKLNGICARYYQGKFYSRENKTWPDGVVKHLVDKINFSCPDLPKDVMLQGEFYHHGWPLGEHVSNINVNLKEPTERTKLIDFVVVDFWSNLYKHIMFKERWEVLFNNRVPYLNKLFYIHDKNELDELFKASLTLGYEGIIIINPDSTYKDGKTNYNKMKLKKSCNGEFLIVGLERGKGRLKNTLGQLVCQAEEGKEFRVGTGFTDKERKILWESMMKYLGKFVTVKYQELSKDGIPLNPVFISLRNYE